MPVDRTRKSKTPKGVPEMGDPDRKRVLNVLAQRRYRERRKAKFAALEAQAKDRNSTAVSSNDRRDDSTGLPAVTPGLSICDSPPDESGAVEEIPRELQDVAEMHVPDIPLMDLGQDTLEMQLFEDLNFASLPSPIPPSSPTAFTASSSSSHAVSSDGGQLVVPLLSTIRAFTTIATCLDLLSKVWDPEYLHTLPPIAHPNLPPNLRPTTAQMTIPHHPFLDALPWPSVREKLICMFSLPSACRPLIAQDDDDCCGQGHAIMRLLQDIDDHRDGVRVHGNLVGWGAGSELVEEAWEIGEVFYRNWWWCLDGRIIGMANRRRRERGLAPLKC